MLKTEEEVEFKMMKNDVAGFDNFVEVEEERDSDEVIESSIPQMQKDQQGCSFWPDGVDSQKDKCKSLILKPEVKSGDSQLLSLEKDPLLNCDNLNGHKSESGVLDDSNDSDSESLKKEYVVHFLECNLENEDNLSVEQNWRDEEMDSSVLPTNKYNTSKRVRKLRTCPKCDYTSFDCSNMNGHMRTHTGEKRFECNICQKKFSYSSHLNNHIRTHTGEKPFKCTACSKTFAQSSALKTHLRTHTGEKHFECTVCAKMFPRSADVRIHMRSHTGEKPFKCKVCAKTFSRSTHLKSHMGIHASEKQFKCKLCSKKFTYSCNLIRHMRVHR